MDFEGLLEQQGGYQFALTLPIQQLLNICKANEKLNLLYCENEKFWEDRFNQDFKVGRPLPQGSWKENYLLILSPQYLELAEKYFQPSLLIPGYDYSPGNLNSIFLEIGAILNPESAHGGMGYFLQPKLEDPLDKINRTLANIQIANDMLNERYQYYLLAKHLIENSTSKEDYFERYDRNELQNMSHEQVMQFVQFFGLPYINDEIAKRKIIGILSVAGAIKR